MFKHDIAIRERHCHTCQSRILKGEHHLKYSSSGIGRNACLSCLRSVAREVEKAEVNRIRRIAHEEAPNS